MAKRVLNQWRGYTVADCDCKYCLYYGGRKKGEVNCLAEECVCKEELQEAPFAAMGFVNYNGMTAEQFVWAWLRSEILEPKQIKFEPVNIYYEALKDAIDEREKEVSKHND